MVEEEKTFRAELFHVKHSEYYSGVCAPQNNIIRSNFMHFTALTVPFQFFVEEKMFHVKHFCVAKEKCCAYSKSKRGEYGRDNCNM